MSRIPPGVWIGAGVLLLLVVPVALNKPRGIRNHNPGNLRPLGAGQLWAGQPAGAAGLDTAPGGPFVVFADADGKAADYWGIRALSRLLLNYQRNHGLFTVEGIINRYAPPSENQTSNYARVVAKQIGVAVDQPIDLAGDPRLHRALVEAVIKHENGQQPYGEELLASAVHAGRA